MLYQLESILKLLSPQITALMALICADILLGVACAIRQKSFNWRRIANFYYTMILPLLIGWLAFGVLAHFAGPEVLGAEIGPLAAGGVTWAAWLVVVGEIGASITENARGIYKGKLPLVIKESVTLS